MYNYIQYYIYTWYKFRWNHWLLKSPQQFNPHFINLMRIHYFYNTDQKTVQHWLLLFISSKKFLLNRWYNNEENCPYEAYNCLEKVAKQNNHGKAGGKYYKKATYLHIVVLRYKKIKQKFNQAPSWPSVFFVHLTSCLSELWCQLAERMFLLM